MSVITSNKLTIDKMHEIAAKKGGLCLSKVYTNNHSKLIWQCAKGHTWEAIPNSVKRGSWCPHCAGNRTYTIRDMQALALNKGGKCLSKKYVIGTEKLTWQCAEGHVWTALPVNIRHHSWCPICIKFGRMSEQICRTTFEQIFNMRFPKVKPVWLVNVRGNRMELDGFCQELNLAFEYQGEQHYEIGPFTRDEKALQTRKADDLQKLQLCKANGISLVVIKYNQDLRELPKLIRNFSIKNRIDLREADFEKDIDFNKIHSHKTRITEMREIAREKGGKCLSKKYVRGTEKLTWQCAEGHIWRATATNVKNKNRWCPKCAKNTPLTIDDMRMIAKERGGQCLSGEYVNSQTKLKWQCANGHEWEAIPSSIKKGSWCGECIGKNPRIEDFKYLAESRGGQCLSSHYSGAKSKLKWKCAMGHIWEATPDNIKNDKTWCPNCSNTKKLTITAMRQLANQKGGQCLSKEYVNARTKLKWCCSKGHEWEATPDSIKKGKWCHRCGGSMKLTIEEMRMLASVKGGKCLSTDYVNLYTKLIWECSK